MSAAMPMKQLIRPLLIAPLGGVIAFAVMGLSTSEGLPYFAFMSVMVWCYSLAAEVVCVIPILALVPRLRQAPVWIAAPWGLLAAMVFGGFVIGKSSHLAPYLMVAGATSGFLYAVVARNSMPEHMQTLFERH